MSDVQQGPGWWIASDGKWYPPETHPSYRPPPPPLPPEPPPSATAQPQRIASILFAVSGAGIIAGAFLPWIKATAPLVGTITRSGVEGGGDGVLFVIAGAVIILLGLRVRRTAEPLMSARIAGVFGLLTGIGMIAEWHNVSNRLSSVTSEYVSGTEGSGLFLIAAAAVLAVGTTMYLNSVIPPSPVPAPKSRIKRFGRRRS